MISQYSMFRPDFKRFALVALLALVPTLLTASPAAVNAAEEKAATEEKPAIRVESETVSQQDFQQQVQRRVQQISRQMKARNQGGQQSGPSKQKLTKMIEQQVKRQMVTRLVLKVHAEKSDIEVPEEKVESQWKQLAKRYGSEKKLNEAISQSGQTTDSIRQQIRESVRVQMFLDQKTGEHRVSDEEARSYYEKNSKRFKGKKFEAVRSRIKQMLKQQKRRQAVQKVVQKLKGQTEIEVNV